ncbi:hypothetical protein SMC37_000307 [Cronobacter sakazakii]|nr:hypothetical protein [Cronobacter sakazakii]
MARAAVDRQRVAALAALADTHFRDLFLQPCVILADQHRDVLVELIRLFAWSAGGAVARHHVHFLGIQHQFQFAATSGSLAGALRCLALCCGFRH